jgi:hypothetical protein
MVQQCRRLATCNYEYQENAVNWLTTRSGAESQVLSESPNPAPLSSASRSGPCEPSLSSFSSAIRPESVTMPEGAPDESSAVQCAASLFVLYRLIALTVAYAV